MTQEILQAPTPNSVEAMEVTPQAGELGTGVKPGELVMSLGTTTASYLPDVNLDAYKGKEGAYNVNNGTVCAVLPESGEVVSAPLCGVIERFIADQGLALDRSMGVMGSNSEFYEGRLGEYARGNGRDHKLGLALAADAVEQTSVLPDYRDGEYVHGDWFALSKFGYPHTNGQTPIKRGEMPRQEDIRTIDGISVAHESEETETRLREVGHYGTNNGVISFVDGRGEVFAAPLTAEREAALLSAGYTFGEVSVPLSNGEQLLDENQRNEWNAMMEQAAHERAAVAATAG